MRCFLQPRVIAYVGETARSDEALNYASHVHVQKRCCPSVLELQDRIGNVLPDGWDLAMIAWIRGELSTSLGSILCETKKRLGSAAPQPQWPQELLQILYVGRGELVPIRIFCYKRLEETRYRFSSRALEKDLGNHLMVDVGIF